MTSRTLRPDAPADATAAWRAVSAVFASLGRVFVCLDSGFQVIHASLGIDDVLGDGSAALAAGRPAAALLGDELFGEAGAIRIALARGDRREGWRAVLADRDGRGHPVAVTAAPFTPPPGPACDPRVAFIVVLRPAEQDDDGAGRAGAPAMFGTLVARSASMRRIFGLVDDLAGVEPTVLLTGESGTGKEVLARAIHARSPRWSGPFVAVNCAALHGELLESELFGHVRGAFTGAVRDREGRFELARGGTLFLDEIGDVPLHLQVKLLRVLQDRSFERVGESRSQTADVRIIAATNVDLPKAVADGRFREDLYYRLRVVPIELPPLRDRREDIEPLAHYLLTRVGAARGRELRFSPDALELLARHHWPGNVRELENALEYAVAVTKGQTVMPANLPDSLVTGAPASRAPRGAPEGEDHLPLDASRLRRVLEAHRWNRSSAARALGISRVTLWRRLREHGLA
ncbi:MAG: sigma-54 interaction domain-containing protein [Vicinamibacterales bacterium]